MRPRARSQAEAARRFPAPDAVGAQAQQQDQLRGAVDALRRGGGRRGRRGRGVQGRRRGRGRGQGPGGALLAEQGRRRRCAARPQASPAARRRELSPPRGAEARISDQKIALALTPARGAPHAAWRSPTGGAGSGGRVGGGLLGGVGATRPGGLAGASPAPLSPESVQEGLWESPPLAVAGVLLAKKLTCLQNPLRRCFRGDSDPRRHVGARQRAGGGGARGWRSWGAQGRRQRRRSGAAAAAADAATAPVAVMMALAAAPSFSFGR